MRSFLMGYCGMVFCNACSVEPMLAIDEHALGEINTGPCDLSDEDFQRNDAELSLYLRMYEQTVKNHFSSYAQSDQECSRRRSMERVWMLSKDGSLYDAATSPNSTLINKWQAEDYPGQIPPGANPLNFNYRYIFGSAGPKIVKQHHHEDGSEINDNLLNSDIQPMLGCQAPYMYSRFSNTMVLTMMPIYSGVHGPINKHLRIVDEEAVDDPLPQEILLENEIIDVFKPEQFGYYMASYAFFGRTANQPTGLEHVLFIKVNKLLPLPTISQQDLEKEKRLDFNRKKLRSLLSSVLPDTPVVFISH